jgi:hypothetical protein
MKHTPAGNCFRRNAEESFQRTGSNRQWGIPGLRSGDFVVSPS